MYISEVTPRRVSASATPRWLVIAAALALAGLIAVAVVLSSSRATPGPGPASLRPASVQSGYFRDPTTHVLLPFTTTRVIPLHETSGTVAHPRP